jgi:hypothetical protein
MDKSTGFRACMVLIAAVVLFALIALYRNNKGQETFKTKRYKESGADFEDAKFSNASFERQGTEYGHEEAVEPYYAPPTLPPLAPPPAATPATKTGGVLPSEPLENEQYRMVDYPSGSATVASVGPSRRSTTEDLLPKDASNTRWAQVTPSGQGELKDLNFMNAGWHIGINTQGQSLKNPNLQLRSDPINPQYKVSPWNMSTVEPDTSRRPFVMT